MKLSDAAERVLFIPAVFESQNQNRKKYYALKSQMKSDDNEPWDSVICWTSCVCVCLSHQQFILFFIILAHLRFTNIKMLNEW